MWCSGVNRLIIYYVKLGKLTNLTNAVPLCFNITSFRPVPTARHSLTLGRSFGTGHSLPGASPLDPLVHIFNPSSCTHVSSQSSMLHF